MSTIKELELRKRQVQAEISNANKCHQDKIKALEWEEREAQTQINMICSGLDVEKILHAEHILQVSGAFKDAGSDKDIVLKRSVDQIIEGGGSLFREYMGTKNYDRFSGQFISCSYGCGPRHGSVVFQVGLMPAIRNNGVTLDDSQIECCLYYLNNIGRIQESKAERRATA